MTFDESTGILAAAKALQPIVTERIPEMESARQHPADLARQIAAAGLYRTLVPQSLGGLECDPATALRSMEIMAEADGSAGWCTMIASTTGLVSAYLPEEHARPIYGKPDAITGGVFAPMGKANVEGDMFRVSGQWQWGSGSPNCDWLMGGCMIFENGEMRKLPNGHPDSRMVIFPREDAELIDTWYTTGMIGTGSGDMKVTDILIPQSRSISLVTDKPRVPGALYKFPIFGMLALGIAAVALGNSRAAMNELRDLAISKRRRDSRRTISETGQGQSTMAQCEAAWRSARAYYYESVAQAWEQAQTGDAISTETRANLRLTAVHATRTAADIARDMYDIGGGTSVFLNSPLQRKFRDAHVATQHMMVAHSTWEVAGRSLFGLEVDATFL